MTGDFVVLSGLIEYLHDPSRLLAAAAAMAPRGAVSYSPLELLPDKHERRQHGWVNDFTENDFRELLQRAGWKIASIDNWWVQRVFQVDRREGVM